MGMFLNSGVPYTAYEEISSDRYFVDKSDILNELIPAIGSRHRYFCILRPRRFGKTVMADMIAAFFGKTEEQKKENQNGHKNLFDSLSISGSKDYRTHLHKHNVIYIDLSRTPENCTSYTDYIKRIISI